jgi:hypothetical protein
MNQSFLTDLASSMERLGFSSDDKLIVQVGGAQTYEIDGAGTKWAPIKGHTNYNNDAFIVIKRRQEL